MTRGICEISTGFDYDCCAAYTVFLSQQFTNLPFTIITNLKPEQRNPKWSECKNVSFIYVDENTDNSRHIKHKIYRYSPYDETIYMDCDSIITKPGIELVFDHFNNNNIILQRYVIWFPKQKYSRIYQKTVHQFNVQLPLNVMLGGFFIFKPTNDVINLFELWDR